QPSHQRLHSFPTRRSSDLDLISPHEAWLATGDGVVHWREDEGVVGRITREDGLPDKATQVLLRDGARLWIGTNHGVRVLENGARSEEHTSELQSREKLVCR